MSLKSRLIKLAIKLTPNKMVVWVANFILKDIAELTNFTLDIDTRQVYVQIQLLGESETIEVWLDDFAILSEGQSHQFILHQAKSNRLWLNNLLAKVSGKTWKIPRLPAQFASYMELVAEVLEPQISEPQSPETPEE